MHLLIPPVTSLTPKSNLCGVRYIKERRLLFHHGSIPRPLKLPSTEQICVELMNELELNKIYFLSKLNLLIKRLLTKRTKLWHLHNSQKYYSFPKVKLLNKKCIERKHCKKISFWIKQILKFVDFTFIKILSKDCWVFTRLFHVLFCLNSFLYNRLRQSGENDIIWLVVLL